MNSKFVICIKAERGVIYEKERDKQEGGMGQWDKREQSNGRTHLKMIHISICLLLCMMLKTKHLTLKSNVFQN